MGTSPHPPNQRAEHSYFGVVDRGLRLPCPTVNLHNPALRTPEWLERHGNVVVCGRPGPAKATSSKLSVHVFGSASWPRVHGRSCWAQRLAERGEVVGVAGEDVVADAYGGDHEVGVDHV